MDAVPDGMCQCCTFCLNGTGIEFEVAAKTVADPVQVQAILHACNERDDPRLLARFAFGITSPRLTALRCSSSHPLFGSMVNVDFNTLVQVFDHECRKVQYTSTTVTSVVTNPRKRPSGSGRGAGSSGRGASGSGRGGNYYKRVKY
jgi:uncharacterized membrane protein YgcG